MPNLSEQALYFVTFGDKGKPAVVFLHGFLGNHQDWFTVIDRIKKDYYCIALDLPGHGFSYHINCMNFAEVSEKISSTLQYILNGTSYYLVGYSLGGRLAMNLAAEGKQKKLSGIIIESGHLGLMKSERAARRQHDENWSQRFLAEPLAKVLQDWYQQSVFSSLSNAQKAQLIQIRSKKLVADITQKSYKTALAKILLATSLSQQPCFTAQNFKLPFLYLCGALDKKFAFLAARSGLDYIKIANAGHNIHFEQANIFAKQVINWLKKQETNTWQ